MPIVIVVFEDGVPGNDLGERDRVRGRSAIRLQCTFKAPEDPLTPTLSPTLSPTMGNVIANVIGGAKAGERGLDDCIQLK